MKDYYNILGVNRGATTAEIKKAFRKLAQQHHPDKKDGNEEKFKEISEAYAILGDEKKRAQYDRFGSAGAGQGQGFEGFDFSQFGQGGFGQGSQFEFDLGAMFGDMFGAGSPRQRQGRDIQMDLELTLSEALLGVEKQIAIQKVSACNTCAGTGAKHGKMETCKKCDGTGYVKEQRRTVFGSMNMRVACGECQGLGKVVIDTCGECSGAGVYKQPYTQTIAIPSGIQDGQMIRIEDAGEAIRAGAPGDLIIVVHITVPKHLNKEQRAAIEHLRKLGL